MTARPPGRAMCGKFQAHRLSLWQAARWAGLARVEMEAEPMASLGPLGSRTKVAAVRGRRAVDLPRHQAIGSASTGNPTRIKNPANAADKSSR